MAMNTGKLAGRTAFITGASRGIGKAIAVKLARDGANIVIAAKTAEPHPKLPGTIYTAAKEIEEAGGNCLPCIADIRDDNAVQKAVEAAVSTYGGIDILVNNASAISLTGTLETPMKRYDLMNGINARGTYLWVNCLQHQFESLGKWSGVVFQAYTMAKYGMSMCVLGMAEEFKEDGIAVNALWPRTGIATAAIEMLGGEEALMNCRKPEIMSDAAYVILTRDSRSRTGEFLIDDDVLKEVGVKDFSHYAWDPDLPLMPDFFLDEALEQKDTFTSQMRVQDIRSKSGEAAPSGGAVGGVFDKIQGLLDESLVKNVGGVFQFVLKGAEAGEWYVDLKTGKGSAGKGKPPTDASVTMTLDSEDFVKMFKGELKATNAFMSGKLKIKGDMMMAMKLEKLMKQLSSKL